MNKKTIHHTVSQLEKFPIYYEYTPEKRKTSTK